MEEAEIDDRTLNKLMMYFDKRFQVLEKELQRHSTLLASISANVRKIVEVQPPSQREGDSKGSYKEFTLQKSLQDQLAEIRKSPQPFTQRTAEPPARVQFAEIHNLEIATSLKSRNKENTGLGPASTEPFPKKSSPSFGKTKRKEEADVLNTCKDCTNNNHQKENYYGLDTSHKENITKKLDLDNQKDSKKCNNTLVKIDESSSLLEGKSEDLSINSIFSPSQQTGDTKELIIEPIDVMIQESPRNTIDRKAKQSIRPSSTSKYLSKSPNNENSVKIKPFNVSNHKGVEYVKLDSLPGACLYLIGQFIGGSTPFFVFSCKNIMDKYSVYAGKRISEKINTLKDQQITLVL